jgi:hypothetical protein
LITVFVSFNSGFSFSLTGEGFLGFAFSTGWAFFGSCFGGYTWTGFGGCFWYDTGLFLLSVLSFKSSSSPPFNLRMKLLTNSSLSCFFGFLFFLRFVGATSGLGTTLDIAAGSGSWCSSHD